MLVTLSGIVIDVRVVHPQKEPLPILLTPPGIVIDVKDVHP
jgi:hypothetical protein